MFDTQRRSRDQILIWLLCHIQKEWVDETARPWQQHIIVFVNCSWDMFKRQLLEKNFCSNFKYYFVLLL